MYGRAERLRLWQLVCFSTKVGMVDRVSRSLTVGDMLHFCFFGHMAGLGGSVLLEVIISKASLPAYGSLVLPDCLDEVIMFSLNCVLE